MRQFFGFLVGLVVAAAVSGSHAWAGGAVVLTVNSTRFDRAQLEALPQASFESTTPWTTGVSRFEGPLLRDVLAAAGVTGSTLVAVALNDYKAVIPAADANQYQVIVAIRRNGEYMPVRDKGPLWVVYPLDSDRSLRTPEIHARMIWQLKSIVVE